MEDTMDTSARKPVPAWPTFSQQAHQGSQNPKVIANVKAIQFLLLQWNPGLSLLPDGDYGYYTFTAVISFQQSKGLTISGQVDQYTFPSLIVTIQQNSSSANAVKAAQVLLRDKFNYVVNVDGGFGQYTYNATILFQTAMGLSPVDGIIGNQTWRYLFGYDSL
jgi:peptidoglycan hydrolase-like protein with peptidoglycan-binding domain